MPHAQRGSIEEKEGEKRDNYIFFVFLLILYCMVNCLEKFDELILPRHICRPIFSLEPVGWFGCTDLPLMRSLELAVRMQSCVALIWNAYLYLPIQFPSFPEYMSHET
jgi:hypothetical protein